MVVYQKRCSLCDTVKSIDEFSWKSFPRGVKQSYCKICQNKRSQAHYYKYRLTYIEKARKRNKKVLEQIQNYVWNYLSSHPCIDCGEQDRVVLEFDHINKKEHNLSEIIKERSSLKVVVAEIEKCVVRCANCHRRKTAKDFGWRKVITPR
jgi:hypothetical protein